MDEIDVPGDVTEGPGEPRLGRVLAALLALVVVSIAGAVLVATLVPAPTITVDLRPDIRESFSIESRLRNGAESPTIPADTVLTSEAFAPRIVFKVRGGGLAESEFCVRATSERMIELRHVHSCDDGLRIIRPVATDCGGLDDMPDATTFATALLAEPGLGATDLGSLGDGGVPARMFQEAYAGRVIAIPGDHWFDGDDDIDDCRMIVTADDPDGAIVVRRLDPALLVLLDLGGELVSIWVGPTADPETISHLVESIYDIRFG